MPKRPRKPRPRKPPAQPRPGQFTGTISLVQEKLIGRVVVKWSKLEAIMDELIWHLLKAGVEIGRIMTTRMDALTKTKTLCSLGELELSENQFNILFDTLDDIDMLREDRNVIVHGNWARCGPENVPFALSLRANSPDLNQVIAEPFPDTRMRAIVRGIETANQKLIALIDELHTLPDRPAPQHPAD